MDSDLKKEVDSICEDFGMPSTTAINVSAEAVVREGRIIPFEIYSDRKRAACLQCASVVRQDEWNPGYAPC